MIVHKQDLDFVTSVAMCVANITSIFLLPFIAFYIHAFAFKKPEESFIDLFIKTYKIVDVGSFFVVLGICAIIIVLTLLNQFLGIFASVVIMPYYFVLLSFFYYSRLKEIK